MTTFNPDRAIFLQMGDRICDEILAGKYKEEERIPSMREYAVTLSVNTNTAFKAYEALSYDGIIYNKRGMGYFVCQGAKEKILNERRRKFMDEFLPDVIRQMKLIGLTLDDLEKKWNEQEKKIEN
ncbi:MAG: GntR family transcriptional regulator [Marinilabiliaceae bacterium]|nr:GntR family transcriptional regulator [Marinilabiliaceae bacterium]